MGMTSVVLILLAISVRAVSWADSALQRREARRAASEVAPQTDVGVTDTDAEVEATDGRARAAVIAVALALSRQTQSREKPVVKTLISSQGSALHDAWLTEGRARQRATRGLAGSAKEWR